ncbi:MAG TPA: VanZ family protein [Vicinamibacteria bacterium]|nr:VanZ family protein [Vicinamibacteria bacterium]
MADVPLPELTAVARAIRLWGPVVLWMGAVFFLSSLSRLGDLARIPDWITHPIEFGVGGFLVCHALSDGVRPSWRVLAASVLLTTTYGVADEYHQSFVPGRVADPADVARDFVGAAAAALVYRWAASGTSVPSEGART